jgi:hypothetical protein
MTDIWNLFRNASNPSSLNMVFGLTQLLTEMSTRNLPGGRGGKARPVRKTDLTAISESIIYKMCDP